MIKTQQIRKTNNRQLFQQLPKETETLNQHFTQNTQPDEYPKFDGEDIIYLEKGGNAYNYLTLYGQEPRTPGEIKSEELKLYNI